MDELNELLTTAGTIDVVKMLMIVALLVSAGVLIYVRNSGHAQKRDDDFRAELFSEFKKFIISMIEIQQADRIAFNRAVETFAEDSRMNKEERERDRQYRESLKNNVEKSLKENKVALEDFSQTIQAVSQSHTVGLESLIEAKRRLDDMIKAIKDYHQTVSDSNEAHKAQSQLLTRIEAAVGRVEAQLTQFIESKIQESKPGSSTGKPDDNKENQK